MSQSSTGQSAKAGARFPGPRLPRELAPGSPDQLQDELTNSRFLDQTVRGEFSGLSLERCHFSRTDLSQSVLSRALLRDLSLEQCQLVNARWVEGGMSRVSFSHCQMSGFSANSTALVDVSFGHCQLQLASFRFLGRSRVRFLECQMEGVDFQGTDLSRSSFEHCTLRSANFQQANLSRLDLRSCTIDDVGGIDCLRGAVVTTEQLIGLAHGLAAQAGIVVQDQESAR